MRPFRDLIPFEHARKIIMESIKPIQDEEQIPIENAMYRVLSENITSPLNIPPFARAAEDGYAIQAQDSFGAGQYAPNVLKLIGKINTGESKNITISTGEAVEIATGAPLPTGADAVVRVEDTEKNDETIKVYRPVHPGFDVAPAGEDIKKGDVILKSGDIMNPQKIGAIAAVGISHIKVYRKPKVAILPSGDELTKPGKKRGKGKIYDVNSYTLFSIVSSNGGIPVLFDYIHDEIKHIERNLIDALKYDIVIFSGGSSVGERDLLVDVVNRYGEIKFHGVQVKPGKPTWFALVNRTPVFGMPGFPTSCLNDAYQFLVPALRKMAHLPERKEKIIKAKMARRITSTLGRMQFFTVYIKNGYAHPAYKTSGAITSLANSDGYIIIPATSDLVEKNEEVTVHLWSGYA